VDFVAVLDQVIALLRQRGRVTYRTLQRQFQLDDDALHDLKDELLYAHPEVRDDAGRGLVWTGDAGPAPAVTSALVESPGQVPLAYTPPYPAEKILTSHSALEGERKQVTVLFADLKGSMELLADRDPEEARQLLDPVLERMMAAVHRYEGTVNQVLGDGIMALLGPRSPTKIMQPAPVMPPWPCRRRSATIVRRYAAPMGLRSRSALASIAGK
jgi:hypothetical protein